MNNQQHQPTTNNSQPLDKANPFQFRGKRLDYHLKRIAMRFPLVIPTDKQVSDVDALSFCVMDKLEGSEGDGEARTWVSLSEKIPLPRERLIVFLSMICNGHGEREAMDAVSMSAAEIGLCAVSDKDGFKLLLAEAREWKLKAMQNNAVDCIETMVKGLKRPIIGRTGKDEDGILTDKDGKELWETKYSDRAAIFALERLHKRFAPPARESSGAGPGNGTTIVYNISVGSPAQMPAIPAPERLQGAVIDIAEREKGESLAKMVGE